MRIIIIIMVVIYLFHRWLVDVKRSLNLCLFLNSESCLVSVLLFGSVAWLTFVTRYEEMEISR